MPLIQKLFIWYFKTDKFLWYLIMASAIFLYPETCTLLEEVEKSIREFGVRKSFMKEVK
jgi:hypothetical protein